MLRRIAKPAFLLLFLSIFLYMGCSESNSPNFDETDSAITQTVNSVENDLALLKENGLGIDSSQGIFTIDWHKIKAPMMTNPITVGQALAVAFDGNQQQRPPFIQGTIDMGSVFVNYAQNQVELNKMQDPNGNYFYSLLRGPRPGGPGSGSFRGDLKEGGPGNQNGHGHPGRGEMGSGPGPMEPGLEYIANTIYQFEITGSEEFDPVSFDLTSPPALLNVTSPENEQHIDPTQDLNIVWEGGDPAGEIMLRLIPHLRQQPAPRPGPPPQQQGIFVLLNNNPGSYTITAAEIRDLLSQTNTTRFECSVSQVNKKEVSHSTGTLAAVLRVEDGILLKTE